MSKPGDALAAVFKELGDAINYLTRVEFIAVLLTVMFLAMFIFDIYRRQFRNIIFVTSTLGIADSASSSLMKYLQGAMGTTFYTNQIFPIWWIMLLSFQSSVNYITRQAIHKGHWLIHYEVDYIVNVWAVVLAVFINPVALSLPVWLLCTVIALRSVSRCVACQMALKSSSHGQSSKLLQAYMKAQGQKKILVHWESEHKVRFSRPRYIPDVVVADKDSVITLDEILLSDGPLLKCSSSHGDFNFKDLCLAFSLSRLLRCLPEGVELDRDTIAMSKELIIPRIMGEAEDQSSTGHALFSILELEVAFVSDYFHSSYPIVFCKGLCSLAICMLQSVATILVACWLVVDLSFDTVTNGSADMIITWVFLLFVLFKETWEMVTYLLSNWMRLLLACKYVKYWSMCMRKPAMEHLIGCFLKSNIADQWHGTINQHGFLQSFQYKPRLWNLMHYATLGLVPKRDEGRPPDRAIRIPEHVRTTILKELRSLDLSGHQLLKDMPSLRKHNISKRFGWACYELASCSHVILAWHIATSLCEIKLAEEHGVTSRVSKPGFMCSTLSSLTQFCCSPQPYLIKENILQGQLQTRYSVANSLSRYCTYLVAFQPALLPDSFLVPEMVFNNTVRHACEKMKDCMSLLDIFHALIELPGEATQEGKDEMKRSRNIVQQGAILGKELIDLGNELCWEILSGVWADLLIHIAPSHGSQKAKEHVRCLQSGGEFITHIWALLQHCGIDSSRLWLKDKASGDTGLTPQGNNAEPSNIQSVVVTQQVGLKSRDYMIRIDDPHENGVESSEQGAIRNFWRSQKDQESTLRSEIQEVGVNVGIVVKVPEILTTEDVVKKSNRNSVQVAVEDACKSMVILTPMETLKGSRMKGEKNKTRQRKPGMMSSRMVHTGKAIEEKEQKSASMMKNVKKTVLKGVRWHNGEIGRRPIKANTMKNPLIKEVLDVN